MRSQARRVAALEVARPQPVAEDRWIDPETGERRTIEQLCDASLLAFDVTDYINVRHGGSTDRGLATPNPDLVKFAKLSSDRQDAFVAAIFLLGHQVAGGRRTALPAFTCVPAGNHQYHSVLTADGWAEVVALSECVLAGQPADSREITMGLLNEPMP